MATDLTKYQDQCGRLQGADGFFFKTAAGAGFAFFEEVDATAEQIMLGLMSWQTMRVSVEATASAGAISTFASGGFGVYPLVASNGGALQTLKLPAPRKGAVLVLNFDACTGNGHYSILAQSGGSTEWATDAVLYDSCSLTDCAGTGLSSFEHSAAGTMILLATSDSNWAIVQADASTTTADDGI